MNCPFRHDIECKDCVLYIDIEWDKGCYSSCAIVEIAERLKQIAEREK